MTASRLNAPRIYSPSLNRPMKPRSVGVKRLPSGRQPCYDGISALPKSLLWAQSQPRLRLHMANVRYGSFAADRGGLIMRFAASSKARSGFVAAGVAVGGALSGSAASVIRPTASLPLIDVPYISPTGAGCFTLASVCVTPGVRSDLGHLGFRSR